MASSLLEPGPAAAALLAASPPVTKPGLNVGKEKFVGVVVVAFASYPNPRHLPLPTKDAFLPFPSLNRDFLNHGV